MREASSFNRNQWSATALCAALLVACVTLSHPIADLGIADDFSYAKSAEILARTGHVVYNGWSTAMLGWQLYWGALFYRLFGYTWFAIRLSGLTISVFTAALLHRILLRCGLSARNAVLGTLTVVLSPLFLPLAYSFMSDIFGLFALLACMYCCLRALAAYEQSRPTSVLIVWLVLTTIAGVVFGTTRQISWIGALTLMPTAAWMMRRRRAVLATGLLLWAVSGVCIAELLRWFQMQPYSLRESFYADKITAAAIDNFTSNLARGSLELPFLVLPAAMGWLFYVSWRARRTQVLGVLMVLATLAYAGIGMHQHTLRSSLLPTLQGVLSDRGMWFIQSAEMSWWPIVLPAGARLLASVATLLALFAVIAVALKRTAAPGKGITPHEGPWVPTQRTLFVLLWPTIAAYALLLLPRTVFSMLFDRYFLWFMVLLPLFGFRSMQLLQRKDAERRAQWMAACVITILATYGTLAMHDLFSMNRARLIAADRLRQAGVPHTSINAGFEYNGTTEIETAGYVNDARINPASARIAVPARNWQEDAFWHVRPLLDVGVAYATDGCHSVRPPVPVGNLLGPALVITTTTPGVTNGAEHAQPCR